MHSCSLSQAQIPFWMVSEMGVMTNDLRIWWTADLCQWPSCMAGWQTTLMERGRNIWLPFAISYLSFLVIYIQLPFLRTCMESFLRLRRGLISSSNKWPFAGNVGLRFAYNDLVYFSHCPRTTLRWTCLSLWQAELHHCSFPSGWRCWWSIGYGSKFGRSCKDAAVWNRRSWRSWLGSASRGTRRFHSNHIFHLVAHIFFILIFFRLGFLCPFLRFSLTWKESTWYFILWDHVGVLQQVLLVRPRPDATCNICVSLKPLNIGPSDSFSCSKNQFGNYQKTITEKSANSIAWHDH